MNSVSDTSLTYFLRATKHGGKNRLMRCLTPNLFKRRLIPPANHDIERELTFIPLLRDHTFTRVGRYDHVDVVLLISRLVGEVHLSNESNASAEHGKMDVRRPPPANVRPR